MGLIVEMLFPKTCVGCQKVGKYLCEKCRQKTETLGADYKYKKVEGRIGLFKYDGVIKELIKLLKFDLVSDTKDEIGKLAVEELKNSYPNIVEYWQTKKFVIIPIPLHWRRRNWRGFNQAEIVADEIGKILDLKVDNKVFLRIKNTKQQVTSSKADRLVNMENAFEVNDKIPKNLIIFDDVWTTGNTIKSIIKIIPKNTNIWVLTLASGG